MPWDNEIHSVVARIIYKFYHANLTGYDPGVHSLHFKNAPTVTIFNTLLRFEKCLTATINPSSLPLCHGSERHTLYFLANGHIYHESKKRHDCMLPRNTFIGQLKIGNELSSLMKWFCKPGQMKVSYGCGDFRKKNIQRTVVE